MDLTPTDGADEIRTPLFSVQNIFLASLLGLAAWIYSGQSIFVGDTDLWYHLSGGRYIVENGRLPASNYFSFLEPSRAFTDYYWLFQYVVYRIYSVGGYPALMALRFSLYASFILIVFRFFSGNWSERGARGFALNGFLVVTLAMAAGSRFINLRPHCFSYLLSLAFVYILARNRKLVWLLPILAVLWVNFHGITYPVLLVICLSWLAGFGWRRWRSGPLDKTEMRTVVCLVLSMAAIWATPNGGDLIYVPFKFSRLSNEYISELMPRPVWDYFNLRLDHLMPSINTMFSIYLALASFALLRRAVGFSLEPAHLLLFAGGALFLSRGVRFSAEFSILTLPLTASLARDLFTKKSVSGKITFGCFIASALLVAPMATTAAGVVPHKWPYSSAMLPEGSARFLMEKGGGGKVFNHPNYGGFLQWELYPKYRIFMDMEIPFMFHDEDIFAVNIARTNDAAFDRIVGKYRPEYLFLNLADTDLLARIDKRGGYVPVFFDDSSAIFASRELAPEVVNKYEMKEFNPIGKHENSFNGISKGKNREKVFSELKRIAELYPDGGLASRWLAQYYYDCGDYEASLIWADNFQRIHPDSAFIHVVKGDAYRKLGKYDEALSVLREGLEKAKGDEVGQVKKSMAYTYKAKGDAPAAYKLFSASVKTIDTSTTTDELWQYAMSAYLSGKQAEGIELARFAEFKVKSGEEELGTAIREFLKNVDVEPVQAPKSLQ